ncbi:MAG: hypothetical protein CTY29_06695 [Methylobacter sp.]|nr:MAG: hypothetical protein CTY29_06695 [Methylobacter sp.]
MDRDAARDIYTACEKALAALTEAERAITRISDRDERGRLLSALSTAITEVLSGVRAPAVLQHPDLEPTEPLGQPDTELSAEEQEVVSSLQASDHELIDSTLLAECASSWRKVARVVGTAMRTLQDRFPDVPDGYYASRVARLVELGFLESQGNLEYKKIKGSDSIDY